MKEHAAFGGLDREVKKINDHAEIFHVVYDLSIPRFLPREFLTKFLWKWSRDKQELTVAAEPVVHEDFREQDGYLRASSTALVKYEKQDDVGGVPQTKVTWTVQLDLGGRIPKWVQNRQGVSTLMYVMHVPTSPAPPLTHCFRRYLSRMRKHFDRSDAIDDASSLRLVNMIEDHDEMLALGLQPYTDAEKQILRKGKSRFTIFENRTSKNLKMASRTTKAKIAYEDGDVRAWGWATATMRASPARVLAYALDFIKRADEDRDRKDLKMVNDHNCELYLSVNSGVVADREFHNRQIWCKTAEDTFLVVASPMESWEHPLLPNVVRGRFPLAMKLQGGGDETTVEYVVQIDPGGKIPVRLTNFYMGDSLSMVTQMQVALQARRGLEVWDEKDGEATAEMLVVKTDAEKHHGKEETKVEARVRAMMENQRGLKELGQKYAWFEALLSRVVANKLRPAGDSRTKLCNMSEKQARVIGGGLASAIAANLTAPAAIDEWILRYPAMGELDREYVREQSEASANKS
jgi:hypothetical protein